MEWDQRGPTCREGAWAYEGVTWPHWARGTSPIGPAGQALGETLGRASRRGGELAPHSSPLAAGPRLGGGARSSRASIYIKRGGGHHPHTSSSIPSRPAALLSLSLPP